MSDIKEAKKTCKDVRISDLTRNRLLHQEEGLTTIQGLDIDLSWFKLKPEQWIRILEQVQTILLFLLIILYFIRLMQRKYLNICIRIKFKIHKKMLVYSLRQFTF